GIVSAAIVAPRPAKRIKTPNHSRIRIPPEEKPSIQPTRVHRTRCAGPHRLDARESSKVQLASNDECVLLMSRDADIAAERGALEVGGPPHVGVQVPVGAKRERVRRPACS